MSKRETIRLSARKWLEATEAQLEALGRQSTQEMANRVVERTPVDTGFLRSSWRASIGSPPPSPDAPGGDGGIAAAINELNPGQTLYLRNHAAYAMRVEYGFVGQDSAGRSYDQPGRYFVTDTVKAWPVVVRETAARLGIKQKG